VTVAAPGGRAWEDERRRAAAELGRLDGGARQHDVAEVLRVAKAELWRLREGPQSDDPEVVCAVLREYLGRVEAHFVEERRGKKAAQVFDYGVFLLRPDGANCHFVCSGP
jgi:hypothetical protein